MELWHEEITNVWKTHCYHSHSSQQFFNDSVIISSQSNDRLCHVQKIHSIFTSLFPPLRSSLKSYSAKLCREEPSFNYFITLSRIIFKIIEAFLLFPEKNGKKLALLFSLLLASIFPLLLFGALLPMIWQATYCCINKVTQLQNPISGENDRTELCSDK